MDLLGAEKLICIFIIIIIINNNNIINFPSNFCHQSPYTNRNQFRGTEEVLQSRGTGSFAGWMHTYSESPTVSVHFGDGSRSLALSPINRLIL